MTEPSFLERGAHWVAASQGVSTSSRKRCSRVFFINRLTQKAYFLCYDKTVLQNCHILFL